MMLGVCSPSVFRKVRMAFFLRRNLEMARNGTTVHIKILIHYSPFNMVVCCFLTGISAL